jgi:hypothetical protein
MGVMGGPVAGRASSSVPIPALSLQGHSPAHWGHAIRGTAGSRAHRERARLPDRHSARAGRACSARSADRPCRLRVRRAARGPAEPVCAGPGMGLLSLQHSRMRGAAPRRIWHGQEAQGPAGLVLQQPRGGAQAARGRARAQHAHAHRAQDLLRQRAHLPVLARRRAPLRSACPSCSAGFGYILLLGCLARECG